MLLVRSYYSWFTLFNACSTIASDFDNSPFIITIPAGMTRAMVSIPIVNDTIVEGDEDFDVVLQPGSPGIGIGTPGRAVVTIIDDNDGKDYMVVYFVVYCT